MKVVTLVETAERDFFEGSDGAFYTPGCGVEERCRWCHRWAHQSALYYRQVLYTSRNALVCGRHVRREDHWRGTE